jgi:hypothetical protein
MQDDKSGRGVDPIRCQQKKVWAPSNLHPLRNQFATECGKESGEGGVNTDLENAINLVLLAVLAQPGRELYLTRQVTATQQKINKKVSIETLDQRHLHSLLEHLEKNISQESNLGRLGSRRAL